jgi:hypothetical protein
MVERNGRLKAKMREDSTSRKIKNAVVENIVFGSKVYTVEYRSYKGMYFIYNHNFVKHSC